MSEVVRGGGGVGRAIFYIRYNGWSDMCIFIWHPIRNLSLSLSLSLSLVPLKCIIHVKLAVILDQANHQGDVRVLQVVVPHGMSRPSHCHRVRRHSAQRDAGLQARGHRQTSASGRGRGGGRQHGRDRRRVSNRRGLGPRQVQLQVHAHLRLL